MCIIQRYMSLRFLTALNTTHPVSELLAGCCFFKSNILYIRYHSTIWHKLWFLSIILQVWFPWILCQNGGYSLVDDRDMCSPGHWTSTGTCLSPFFLLPTNRMQLYSYKWYECNDIHINAMIFIQNIHYGCSYFSGLLFKKRDSIIISYLTEEVQWQRGFTHHTVNCDLCIQVDNRR